LPSMNYFYDMPIDSLGKLKGKNILRKFDYPFLIVIVVSSILVVNQHGRLYVLVYTPRRFR
jgi:hypothetical protein